MSGGWYLWCGNVEASEESKRLWAASDVRRQIALRALETRRPGKRQPGTSLASCVALAEACKLPVNCNHSE